MATSATRKSESKRSSRAPKTAKEKAPTAGAAEKALGFNPVAHAVGFRRALADHHKLLAAHLDSIEQLAASFDALATSATTVTDSVVEDCVRRAAQPGTQVYDDDILKADLHIRPNDLNRCLNEELHLRSPYRYTDGTIQDFWTVRLLKGDANHRHVLSQ